MMKFAEMHSKKIKFCILIRTDIIVNMMMIMIRNLNKPMIMEIIIQMMGIIIIRIMIIIVIVIMIVITNQVMEIGYISYRWNSLVTSNMMMPIIFMHIKIEKF